MSSEPHAQPCLHTPAIWHGQLRQCIVAPERAAVLGSLGTTLVLQAWSQQEGGCGQAWRGRSAQSAPRLGREARVHGDSWYSQVYTDKSFCRRSLWHKKRQIIMQEASGPPSSRRLRPLLTASRARDILRLPLLLLPLPLLLLLSSSSSPNSILCNPSSSASWPPS